MDGANADADADPPLVTALITTYNRPSFLREAVESVRRQTYENVELVVVDDHSDTPAEETLSDVSDDGFERLRCVRHETNRGANAARNTGIEAASGEFVAFLDDDDVWLPEKLEAQVARLEELGEEYALVYGATRHRDMETDETIFVSDPGLEGDVYREILERGSGSVFGPPSNVMVRADVLEEFDYFDEKMSRGSGQKLFRNVAKRYRVAYTDELCVDYYVHDDRVTTIQTDDELRDAIRVHQRKIDDLGDDLEQVPAAYVREHERIGNLYCAAGDVRTGRRHFQQAIDVGGVRATLLLRLALSYLGSTVYRVFFTPEFRFRQTVEKYERFVPFQID